MVLHAATRDVFVPIFLLMGVSELDYVKALGKKKMWVSYQFLVSSDVPNLESSRECLRSQISEVSELNVRLIRSFFCLPLPQNRSFWETVDNTF